MGRSGGGSQKQRVIQAVTTVALIAAAILCSVLGLDDIASDLFALQGGASYGLVASDQVGNLTFRDAERLESHFQKHGAEMGYGSASDYLAGANAVISNPRALHKTQSEDGDDAYFLDQRASSWWFPRRATSEPTTWRPKTISTVSKEPDAL